MKDTVYRAKVKLRFNKGKLTVNPGEEVILGDEDLARGTKIDLLIQRGALEYLRLADDDSVASWDDSKLEEVDDGESARSEE